MFTFLNLQIQKLRHSESWCIEQMEMQVIVKTWCGYCFTYRWVKSVHIRSFSGPYFPEFRLNTKRYWVRTLFTQCVFTIKAKLNEFQHIILVTCINKNLIKISISFLVLSLNGTSKKISKQVFCCKYYLNLELFI